MNFLYWEYIFLVIPIVFALYWSTKKSDKVFFDWVETFWFYKRSKHSKYSMLLSIAGLTILAISLLDLRGPTENITSKVPEQKTIILIDASLSMLAEDVRPSRLGKAIQVAKHFVRKAAGHNISIMIFSDTTKQMIPFTKDIDLLDARLNALKNLDLNRGGSNIRRAIQESLAYFKSKKEIVGNILVISDSDETYASWEPEIPDTVTVGFIAVGTAKGARIPLRRRNGVLQGYKQFEGQEVTSKLNEAELKILKSKIETFDYWVLGSYSIPTEPVLRFFDSTHKEKYSDSETLIRPVLMEYLVVPGVILLILSYLFRLRPSFFVPVLLVSFLNSGNIHAQQMDMEKIQEMMLEQKAQKLAKVKSDPLYFKYKQGEASKSERLKLAEKYMRADSPDRALKIYKENLSEEDFSRSENFNTYFNYGSSLIENGKIIEGLDIFKELKNKAVTEEQKDKILKNVLALLKRQQQQQQQEQKKKDQEKKQQQQQQQDQQQEQQDQQNQDQQKSGDGEEEQDPKGEKKDKNKGKGNEQDQKQKNQNSSGESDLAKKKKLPIMLKQLIDKDRKLQEKLLDTSTRKKQSLEQKDW